MADTPLLEKKYSTKDVEKGNDELAGMKKAMVTIRSKGLDKFEGQSKGSTGWFKLDSGFKKKHFLQFIQNYINNFFKILLRIKTPNCIQRVLYRLIKNISRQNMKKRNKHDYSIISTRNRINRSAQTSKRCICFIRINGIHMFNRRDKSKCNTRKTHSKEEEIYKITSFVSIKKGSNYKSGLKKMGLNKYQCLTPDVPPFVPGNKTLLNEDNDDDPKTPDTSRSEKGDTSHTSQDDYIAKA